MQKREGDEKYGPMKAGRASRMVNLPDALLLSSSLSFASKNADFHGNASKIDSCCQIMYES